MRPLCVVLILSLASAAAAQTTFSGNLRLRGESWRWFATPNADDDYQFAASQLRLALAHKSGRAEQLIEIEQTSLFGLPEHAVLPAPRGQLGLGGGYFAANGKSTAAGIVLRQAYARWASFQLGRFQFSDGNETTPEDPLLASLKRERATQRLIGPGGFSHVGRSVDGVQLRTPRFVLLAARPTESSFDVHGNGELPIDLGYAAMTIDTSDADARLFVAAYRDRRGVTKIDNRPLAVRAADDRNVQVNTIGAHYLRLVRLPRVTLDAFGWAALQGGRWGAQTHRATAFDAEGGVHWPGAFAPALRAGWAHSSGDGDANDGKHETFFPMVLTSRIHARFPFYNLMNMNDVFVQGSARVRPTVTVQAEVHRLRLTSASDLWYSGGGAADRTSFGFSGRPSSGRDDVGSTIDFAVEYKPRATTTVTFYIAQARGGDVVTRIFDGSGARLAYVELTQRF